MRKIVYITGIAVACLIAACGKSGVSPNTTGGDDSGKPSDGGDKPQVEVVVKKTNTDGGNGSFDNNNKLTGTTFSQANQGKFKTGLGGTDIVSLMHGQNAVLQKMQGAWRATYTASSDTTKQAYLRDVHVAPDGTVTEYRANLNGTLDAYLSTIPDNMTPEEFAQLFNAKNQQVLKYNN